jgi:hypothetical protein
MSAITSIQQYLTTTLAMRERCGFPERIKAMPYSGFEDFTLREGRAYEKAPLSAEQRRYVLACAKLWGKPLAVKQCFYNSQVLMLFTDTEKRLTYCEGYGWRFLPCMHGWLVLDGKHVVDTTWRMDKPMGRGALANRALGTWNDERSYFGVTFSRGYVRSYVLDREHGGSLIDDFKGDYPLLTGAAKPEEWRAPTHVEREPSRLSATG